VVTRGGDSVAASQAGTGPADGLRPFTTTAQVPSLGGPGSHFADTGLIYPLSSRPAPAPVGLRVAVWATAVLLVVGLVGLGVHRLRPSALRALEAGGAIPATSRTTLATRSPARAGHGGSSAAVRQTQTSSTGATWAVDAAQYTVTVSAQAPCWVQVTDPESSSPTFAGVLGGGAQKSFASAGGRLNLLLGASRVTVSVVLGGASTPVWTFTPTAAPFTLSFTSETG
jgi:hypothetical protein